MRQGGLDGGGGGQGGLWLCNLSLGFVTTAQESGLTGAEDVRVIITSSTSDHQY